MPPISVPTKARLPSSLKITPSNPYVQRILNRLSRPALLALALDWLEESNASISSPFLAPPPDEDDDTNDFYPPAESLEELRDAYSDMLTRRGSRREIVDRISEGDWRDGLTLYQLAMADLQYLYDHPTSLKWSAYRLLPLKIARRRAEDENDQVQVDKESIAIHRFHPSTFLENLHNLVPPDTKAHYQFDRPPNLPLSILRVFIIDSPYNTDLALSSQSDATSFSSSRTVFIAFPDSAPFVYISRPQTLGAPATGEAKSLQSLIVEGVPKALSRPRERYTLKSTSLTTRNLSAILHTRGSGRTNTAGGGWSVYADQKAKDTPLDSVLPTPPLSDSSDDAVGIASRVGASKRKRKSSTKAEAFAKRAKLMAQARFGSSAQISDGRGVERVDIMMQDSFPNLSATSVATEPEGDDPESDRTRKTRPSRLSNVDLAFRREAETREEDDLGETPDHPSESETWIPNVRLTFGGPHVFAGLRQLVELGVVNGEKMPAWMTGEEGVTIGAVRHGRIRGHKGSGL